jgi:hypothetical protein
LRRLAMPDEHTKQRFGVRAAMAAYGSSKLVRPKPCTHPVGPLGAFLISVETSHKCPGPLPKCLHPPPPLGVRAAMGSYGSSKLVRSTPPRFGLLGPYLFSPYSSADVSQVAPHCS